MFHNKKFTLVNCNVFSSNGWGVLKGQVPQEFAPLDLAIELVPSVWTVDRSDRTAAQALRQKLNSEAGRIRVGAKLEVTCACVLVIQKREGKDKKSYSDNVVRFCLVDYTVLEQGTGDAIAFDEYSEEKKQKSSGEAKAKPETKASSKGAVPTDEAIAR